MTNTFNRYYNIYGVFHVTNVLFIIAMLLYSCIARGMDKMTLCVYVAFLFNLAFPGTLSQYLTTNVRLIRDIWRCIKLVHLFDDSFRLKSFAAQFAS